MHKGNSEETCTLSLDYPAFQEKARKSIHAKREKRATLPANLLWMKKKESHKNKNKTE